MKNPSNSIDIRRTRVLFATIAEYISSGHPVSSKSLASKHNLGLSPATIRRDLQSLTEQGLLIQPHTSAGRIPSDRAFRLFAKRFKNEAGQLELEKQNQLRKNLHALLPRDKHKWKDVVRLLSDLSYQAALIVTPAFSETVLRQLRFIPCGPGSLLAVVVSREGLVHNAYINPPDAFQENNLERIHNYLSELVQGRTLNQIRQILREELKDARANCDAIREQATILGSEAIQSSVQHTSELLVEGRNRLVGRPDLERNLEKLITVLEEKSLVLELLDQAAQSDRGPLVIIGDEGGQDFNGCAMISSPFGPSGGQGQIGIIGSSRMDYSAVIPLVALAAQFLSTQLLGQDDPKDSL